MAMTDAEFLAHIRQHYSDMVDPEWTDRDFVYFIAINPGWQSLVLEYFERMQLVMREHGVIGTQYVRQIKEKLGELRIYKRPVERVVGIDEERRDIIWTAETSDEAAAAMGAIHADITERAVHTCEECGEPGTWGVVDGYYLTRCLTHLAEYKARRGK